MSKIQLHACIIIVMLSLAAVGAKSIKPKTVAGSTDFKAIPLEFGGWAGTELKFPPETYELLPTASLLYRQYEHEDEYAPVDLAIVYGSDLGAFHQPEVCLTGQGFRRINTNTVMVRNGRDPAFTAISVIMENDYRRTAFLYWFSTQGTTSTSLGNYKVRLLMARLRRGSAIKPSAMIRLSTDVLDSDTEAVDRLARFAGGLSPYLDRQFTTAK